MQLNEFLEIVKTELPESHLKIDEYTKFRELDEWDSLTGMAIVVLIEENYNVDISDSTFKTFDTFLDMFNYVKDHR